MPPYELIVFLRPSVTPLQLSTLFRSVARIVFREQGQFRRVENLGVRPIAHPIRRDGERFDEVRWVTAALDVAPAALPAVYAALKEERDTLQHHTLVSKDPLAAFSNRRPERLKRFPAAMRYNPVGFDPDSLSLRVKSSTFGTAAAAVEPPLR
jgi:ribosomal protein S6